MPPERRPLLPLATADRHEIASKDLRCDYYVTWDTTVMQHLLKDDTQVYKQFVENESFKRFVGDMVYVLTNQ